MMVETREELSVLIRACETAAQTHITYAKRSHTEFQRLFHERRATEALQRAHRYRQQCQDLAMEGR